MGKMPSLRASEHGLRLDSEEDALAAIYSGLPGCIFEAADLHSDFFELKNGIAGGIFQKFSNYRYPAAIVLAQFSAMPQRIQELIRDHQRHPYLRFFESIDDAAAWLAQSHP